jgi:predicted CoA-binding protein
LGDDARVEDDRGLREILSRARTIAVVGIKDGQTEDAHLVPLYMQRHGYRIVPVNPKLEAALGVAAVPSLAEVEEAVDIVNLFRASDHIPGHLAEILAMSPRPGVAWMQLGIQHAAAAAELRAVGIQVVQDRCIMVEHRRLLDETSG